MRGKKYKIELRNEAGKLGEIKRQLHAEAIGNFNPIFCTFKGKRYLVKSDEGDLSDPFRRNEIYLESLYIMIEGEA